MGTTHSHIIFMDIKECLYPDQRGEVLEFPCQSPSTRRISKSEALAEDLEIFLVRDCGKDFVILHLYGRGKGIPVNH